MTVMATGTDDTDNVLLIVTCVASCRESEVVHTDVIACSYGRFARLECTLFFASEM